LAEERYGQFFVVGKRFIQKGSHEKARGEAKYTVDVNLPGMLYAKVLRSPHAHARIVKIDVSRAKALPGVKAVLTHKEVGHITVGAEAALDDRVRYVGDKVAAVAAESEDVAEEALELVDVEYEVLPAVLHPEEAIKPDAPIIHPDIPMVEGVPNLMERVYRYEVGDVEKGFKEADYVFEDRYVTSRQCHVCMEPHVGVASWDSSGKLTYWRSAQSLHMIRTFLARALKMPASMVRVIVPPMGGGFGSKGGGRLEDVLCALLAKEAGRPVKIECTREEEFSTTATRNLCIYHCKTGVKKDGTLTARYMKVIVDTGAYGGGFDIANKAACWFMTPYSCPSYKFEGYAVYTNTENKSGFRGFSSVPPHFAMEAHISRVAEELGIDPVEFRMRNRRRAGEINPSNKQPIIATGFDECMLKGAERIGWWSRRRKTGEPEGVKKRGVGMAAMVHSAPGLYRPEEMILGGNRSSANIEIDRDGTVNLQIGTPDLGQGSDTAYAIIAAEELGVRYEDVTVTMKDSEAVPYGCNAGASQALMLTGGAVREAAAKAKRQLLERASKMLGVPVEDLVSRDRRIFVRGKPEKGIAIADVVRTGASTENPHIFDGKGVYDVSKYVAPWGSQFVEVEVDTETGQVKLLRVVCAHDVGRVINLNGAEGQVEGGAHTGLGYALTEDLVLDDAGRPLNPRFLDYKVLGAADMPKVDVVFVESISPVGVFGAKGLGEMATIPAAPAVAAAVHNAVGVWIRELPITAEKVLKALKEKR